MFRKYFLLSLTLLGVQSIAFSQLYKSSTITDATIFMNKAQLTRKAQIAVSVGNQTIVIDGIPRGVDANTIQVKSSTGISVLSVKHKINYLSDRKENKYVQALRDSIDICEKDIKKQETFLSVLKNEEELLLANKNTGGQNTGISITTLKEISQLYRTRLKEIGLERIDVEIRVQQLNEKLTKLKNQLNNITKNKQPTSEVWVDVLAERETKGYLQLQYITSGSSWNAVYDIKAEENSDKVEVALKAEVYNTTGEDWNNVNITLSTGNPVLSIQKPDLQTWFLYFNEPVTYNRMTMKSAPLSGRAMESQTIDDAMEVAIADAEFVENTPMAQMADNSINMEFNIERPYSVTSGREPVQVLVQKQWVDARMQYSSVPKLNARVYLTAILKNWQQYYLLGGNASVYYNKSYVGNTVIPSNASLDSLTVSLGIDESILISRTRAGDFKAKQSIGSQIKESRKWDIEVKNNKKKQIEILVQDQIPVTTNKDLEVKSVELSGGVLNEKTGIVIWNMQVDALSKKTVQLGYEVKYPEGKKIILE